MKKRFDEVLLSYEDRFNQVVDALNKNNESVDERDSGVSSLLQRQKFWAASVPAILREFKKDITEVNAMP